MTQNMTQINTPPCGLRMLGNLPCVCMTTNATSHKPMSTVFLPVARLANATSVHLITSCLRTMLDLESSKKGGTQQSLVLPDNARWSNSLSQIESLVNAPLDDAMVKKWSIFDAVGKSISMDAAASQTSTGINQIAEQKGLGLRLDDFGPGLYSLATMKFGVTWKKSGKRIYQQQPQGLFCQVPSNTFMQHAVTFQRKNVVYVGATIPTTDPNLIVHVVRPESDQHDDLPETEQDLLELGRLVETNSKTGDHSNMTSYNNVLFRPLQGCRAEFCPDTLLGTRINDAVLVQCLLEATLDMDEKGAKGSMEAAMGMTRCAPAIPRNLVFDKTMVVILSSTDTANPLNQPLALYQTVW
jgi:hypothetical protein